MYYRKNGQIIEGLKGTNNGGLGCNCNMPSWVIILIIILLFIIISFFVYSFKHNSKSKSTGSKR